MKRAALAIMLLAALAACSSGKSNVAGSRQPSGEATTPAAMAAATPDCDGESAVWASERHKTYVVPENPRYGKGKSGSYMCLDDARSQGYHEGRGRGHRRHHHQGALTL